MTKHRIFTRNSARHRLLLLIAVIVLSALAVGAATVFSDRKEASLDPNRGSKVVETSPSTSVRVVHQSHLQSQDTVLMNQLTPEEAQKLAAGLKDKLNQSTEDLVQVRHQDGSVSMDLQGRFQNVTVARINKDGSVSQACVDNPGAAGAFFGIDPKLLETDSRSVPTVKRTKSFPSKN
jgi:hypothetical protein